MLSSRRSSLRYAAASVLLAWLASFVLLSAAHADPTVEGFSNLDAVSNTSSTIDLTKHFSDPNLPGSLVKMVLKYGYSDQTDHTLYLALYDKDAPVTVANFLSYVNSGAYNNSFIHLYDPSKGVIQGGRFNVTGVADITGTTNVIGSVPIASPIPNEYSQAHLNVIGSLAMTGTDSVNSAPNQWFFNTKDNSSSSEQHAVFGEILGTGTSVLNDFAAIQTFDYHAVYGPDFSQWPLDGRTFTSGTVTGIVSGSSSPLINPAIPVTDGTGTSIPQSQLILVTSATQVSTSLVYTATSDNPSIATAVLTTDNQLVLNYLSPGTANITVSATNALNQTVSSTFAVNVIATSSTANIVGFQDAIVSGTEGSQAVIKVNRLSGNTAFNLTYATRNDPNGDATAGTDYVGLSGTLHFAANTRQAFIKVPLLRNPNLAQGAFFNVALLPSDPVKVAGPQTAVVNIEPSSAHGTLQLSATSCTVFDGYNSYVPVTVTRTGGVTGAVSVVVTTNDGSAINGTNYVGATKQVSFANGDAAPQTFFIPTLTGTGTFTISLVYPAGGASIGSAQTETVTIRKPAVGSADPAFVFSQPQYDFQLSAGKATISVDHLDPSTSGTVQYKATTVKGAVVATGSLGFGPGQLFKSFEIPLKTAGTFNLQLLSGTATLDSAVLAVSQKKSDEVFTFGSAEYPPVQGSSAATVLLQRSRAINADSHVLVAVETDPALSPTSYTVTGTNVKPISPNLLDVPIAANKFNTSLNVTVNGSPFAATKVKLTILPSTGVVTGATPETTVTSLNYTNFTSGDIFDFADQVTGKAVTSATAYLVAETDTDIQLTVLRTGNTASDIYYTIRNGGPAGDLAAVAGKDYIAPMTQGPLDFGSGTTATIDIPLTGVVRQFNRFFTVQLVNADGTGAGAGLGSTVYVEILGNRSGVLKFDAQNYTFDRTINGSTNWARLIVNRVGGSSGAIRFYVETSDITAQRQVDYDFGIDNITAKYPVYFADGQTTQVVTVPLLRSATQAGPVTFKAFLYTDSNNNSQGEITPDRTTVTITNGEMSTDRVVEFQTTQYRLEGSGTVTLFAVRNSQAETAKVDTIHYRVLDTNSPTRTSDVSGVASLRDDHTGFDIPIPVTGTLHGPEERFKVQITELDSDNGTSIVTANPTGQTSADVTVVNTKNAPLGVFEIGSPTYQFNANEGVATITVQRRLNIKKPVTILMRTSGGDAFGGSQNVLDQPFISNFQPFSQKALTFAANQSKQTVSIVLNKDSLLPIQQKPQFLASIQSVPVGARIGAPRETAITLLNESNASQPFLSFSSGQYDTYETPDTAGANSKVITVSVNRTDASGTPNTTNDTLQVEYSSLNDGTALSGRDYVLLDGSNGSAISTGTLTFAPGTTSAPVYVRIYDSHGMRPDRFFDLQLKNAADLTPPNTEVKPEIVAPARIFIHDKPAGANVFDFAQAEYNFDEDQQGFNIVLNRTSSNGQAGIIRVTPADDTAFATGTAPHNYYANGLDKSTGNPLPYVVAFGPNQKQVIISGTIFANNPAITTPLDFSLSINDTATARAGIIQTAIVHIHSVHTPGVGFTDLSYFVDEPPTSPPNTTGTAEVTIRGVGITGDTTVWYTLESGDGIDFYGNDGASSPIDYSGEGNSIVLHADPSSPEVTGTIPVTILANPYANQNLIFRVKLTGVSNGLSTFQRTEAPVTIINMNQRYGLFEFAQDAYSADQDAGLVPVTIVRTGPATLSGTVRMTATSGAPIVGANGAGMITIPAGQTQRTVYVPISGANNVTVKLWPTAAGQIGKTGTAAITINAIDNTAAGVGFREIGYQIDNPAVSGTLNVTLRRLIVTGTIPDAGGNVNVSAVDGSAVAGADYNAAITPNPVKFLPNQTEATVAVTVLNSTQPGDRTFTLQLSPAATDPLPILSNSSVQVTISGTSSTSNPVFAFSAQTYSVDAGSSFVPVTVVRSGGSLQAGAVTVETFDRTTLSGTDYVRPFVPVSKTLVFPKGDTTPQTIRIPLIPGISSSNTLTFSAVLVPAAPAATGANALATINVIPFPAPDSTAEATVGFDQPAYDVNTDYTAPPAVSSTTTLPLPIQMSGTGDVIVTYSVSPLVSQSAAPAVPGTDFIEVSGTTELVKTSDGLQLSGTAFVQALSGTAPGPLGFTVTILNAAYSDPNNKQPIDLGQNSQVPVFIHRSRAGAGLVEFANTQYFADSDGNEVTLELAFPEGAFSKDTVVHVATTDETAHAEKFNPITGLVANQDAYDYIPVKGPITIPAGSTTASVKIPLAQITGTNEETHTFLVQLTDTTSIIGAQNTASVTIYNTNYRATTPEVDFDSGSYDANDSATSVTATIRGLHLVSGTDTVTVFYNTKDGPALTGGTAGLDYVASFNSVTLTASNSRADIQVPLIPQTNNGDRTFYLQINAVGNPAGGRNPNLQKLGNHLVPITIHNTNSPYGYFEFDYPTYHVLKGDTVEPFIVRKGPANLAASVRVRTVDGNAAHSFMLSQNDYGGGSFVVNFAPGVVAQPLQIPTFASLFDPAPRSFRAVLTSVGAGVLGAQSETVINAEDQHFLPVPLVGFDSLSYACEEKDGTVGVRVDGLNIATNQKVTVGYQLLNASATLNADYGLPSVNGVRAVATSSADDPTIVATGTITLDHSHGASIIQIPVNFRNGDQGLRYFYVKVVDPQLFQSGSAGGDFTLVPDTIPQLASPRLPVYIHDTSNPNGVFEFFGGPYTVTSGNSVDVVIDRIGGKLGTSTVLLSLVKGTATPNVDYDASVTTVPLTFADGVASMKVTMSTKYNPNLSKPVFFNLLLVPSTQMNGATVSQVYNQVTVNIQP